MRARANKCANKLRPDHRYAVILRKEDKTTKRKLLSKRRVTFIALQGDDDITIKTQRRSAPYRRYFIDNKPMRPCNIRCLLRRLNRAVCY